MQMNTSGCNFSEGEDTYTVYNIAGGAREYRRLDDAVDAAPPRSKEL